MREVLQPVLQVPARALDGVGLVGGVPGPLARRWRRVLAGAVAAARHGELARRADKAHGRQSRVRGRGLQQARVREVGAQEHLHRDHDDAAGARLALDQDQVQLGVGETAVQLGDQARRARLDARHAVQVDDVPLEQLDAGEVGAGPGRHREPAEREVADAHVKREQLRGARHG